MLEAQSYTRLTLALDIVQRLTTGELAGYHELAVVKHQIDLCDDIAVRPAPALAITCDDPAVPCDESNVCAKAVRLLQKEFGVRDEVAIDIRKRIPVMGGLAGGSANAATVLALCARHWGLGLDRAALMKLGRRLGMDVPYYFVGGSAFDTETGADARAIESTMTLEFVICVPQFGVSTRDAYANLHYPAMNKLRAMTRVMAGSLKAGSLEGVAASAHNDFQLSVFPRFPELAGIRARLLELGCLAAWMSGSGSTVVGLVRSADEANGVAQTMGTQPQISRAFAARTVFDGRVCA